MIPGKLRLPLMWLSYKTHRTKLRTHPDRLYIESTNVCNLRCIMCPTGTGRMQRKKGFMDFTLFKQIIDEIAGRVRVVILHTWGEPLLHPRIADMVAYCRQVGLYTEMSTNAVLLDEDKAHQLLEAGLGQVYLCLDGTNSETYEAIRRGGDYEVTRENILRFLDLKNEHHYRTLVNLQLIEMHSTFGQAEEFKRVWSIPGVDRINIKAFDTWANQIDEISQLKVRETEPSSKRYPCPLLWYHIFIYGDGTLVTCDRDYDAKYPLDNVSGGVMKAWNGETMVELRRKHVLNQLGDVPTCRGCVEWSWTKPVPFRSFGIAPQ